MAESVSDFELRAKRGAKFTSVRWDSPAGTTPRVNLRGRLQEKGRTIMLPEWICTGAGPDILGAANEDLPYFYNYSSPLIARDMCVGISN